MKQIRWYDKNSDLKDIFQFIEKLDGSTQGEVAKDILQILMNDFNLDLDEEINNISKNYTYKCKRWYDNNVDLFTSFEIIRNLSPKLQNEVVRKVFESIMLTYLKSEQ